MSRKFNIARWIGEALSITAAVVVIALSVLTFNIGMTAAQQEEPQPEEKKPFINEELDVPVPCAESGSDLAFAHFKEVEPEEIDCGNDTNPAKYVEPQDSCDHYILAHDVDEPYVDTLPACPADNREI